MQLYKLLFKLTKFSAICLVGLSGCSQSVKERDGHSLAKAGALVERYGQIVGQEQKGYLLYLQNRLAYVMNRGQDEPRIYRTILLNTRLPLAASAGGGIILLSRGIVQALQNEAELAFVIAHEMAHHQLGHAEFDTGPVHIDNHDEDSELEADRFAVAVMAAAGYDPHLAVTALKNAYRFSSRYLDESRKYPALEKRQQHIIAFIKSSKWRPPGTVNRTEFKYFKRSLAG